MWRARKGGWKGGLLEPCGFLLPRPAPEKQPGKTERTAGIKKKRVRRRESYAALIAAELRRDALIAPRGCGQCRGGRRRQGGGGRTGHTVRDELALALCQMSSLAPALLMGPMVYKIYTLRQRGGIHLGVGRLCSRPLMVAFGHCSLGTCNMTQRGIKRCCTQII